VQRFERFIRNTSNIFNGVAAILLLILMLQGSVDVIGRYAFNKPLVGTWETSEVWLALLVFFGWGYTQFNKGHVTVEIITVHLSPKVRAILSVVTNFLALGIFILVVWQSVVYALRTMDQGMVIAVINWPLGPFQFFVCLGALLLCLVFTLQIIQSLLIAKGELRSE
jgi:TRAP-type C4-dicarboxylate transport system permease small subunit